MNKNITKMMLLLILVVFLSSPAMAMSDWDFVTLCKNGSTSAVQTAINGYGANVNAKDGYNNTPLHMAAKYNPNSGVVLILLNAGANAKAKDNYGNLPIYYAESNPGLQGTPALDALRRASN
ncbi:MAG: ankyrin repeat domain-containing protein [Verrucomicrobiae bacterium]|nr:ankyrin repeat domain-containing protein [Verrucomicrobiae bacterium]